MSLRLLFEKSPTGRKCKGFERGYEPLVPDTLPKMPYIRGVVPSDAEPVIPVGTNPVGPILGCVNHENLKVVLGTAGRNSIPAD